MIIDIIIIINSLVRAYIMFFLYKHLFEIRKLFSKRDNNNQRLSLLLSNLCPPHSPVQLCRLHQAWRFNAI